MKFISVAQDQDVGMTMQYADEGNQVIVYYDVLDIFGKYSLCPPPNDCGLTDTVRNPTAHLTREQIDSFCTEYDMKRYPSLEQSEVAKMAQGYEDAIKDDYHKVIQSIDLDPELLYEILCKVKGFKLIAAANDKKEITMVIAYTRDGRTSYYDIKSIFPAALCPPPDNCGIPYMGAIKKGGKRPKQK